MINFIKFYGIFKNMHKSPRFNLGRGARFPKKLAQNLFATTVCIAMVLCTMPRGWGGYEAHADDLPKVTLTVDWGATTPTIHGVEQLYDHAGESVEVTTEHVSVPDWARGWTCSWAENEDGWTFTDKPHTTTLHSRVAHHEISACAHGVDLFVLAVVPPRLGYVDVGGSGSTTIMRGGGDVSMGLYLSFAGANFPPTDTAYLDGRALTKMTESTYANQEYFVDYDSLPRTGGASTITFRGPDGRAHGKVELGQFEWTNWPTETDGGDVPQPTVEPEDDPGAENDNYIQATVTINGQEQRLRVYDPNGVLPAGADLLAEVVTTHEHLDDGREIEHIISYNLTLVDGAGQPIPMPRDGTFRLCFEVIPGLDAKELEVVLVKQFADGQFEESLVPIDGVDWVTVDTDRCSPWSLIDRLSEEEKAAKNPTPPPAEEENTPGDGTNVKTGDTVTRATVAGLGMVLVLALGVLLKLNKKNQFES